ncbi:hypothetical protein KAJ38_02765 [Candidatus Pacearchaeota archaeon]|nr:hypothetical protein [Candidatus Pacearchaeota archaeon]
MVPVAGVRDHYISGFRTGVGFQSEAPLEIAKYSSYLNKTSGFGKLFHYIGVACGEIVNFGSLGYFERKSFGNLNREDGTTQSNDNLEDIVEEEHETVKDSKLEEDIINYFIKTGENVTSKINKNYKSKNKEFYNGNKDSPERGYSEGFRNEEYGSEKAKSKTMIPMKLEKGTNMWKIDNAEEKDGSYSKFV